MSLTIEEILAGAELPEDSVRLCLKGSLRREYEEQAEELSTAATVASNLGERAPATEIAERMLELKEQMRPWSPLFKLRALEPKAWRKFLDTRPGAPQNEAERESFDDRYHVWVCQMIAVTCYEPVMSGEQVQELFPKLSGGQWTELMNKSWVLNAERQDIPFSVAASEMIADSATRSRRPEPGVSATPAGSDKSPARSRRTRTTTKDA